MFLNIKVLNNNYVIYNKLETIIFDYVNENYFKIN